MKNILITGAKSYIGMSVENWLLNEKDKYHVDTIDMRGDEWKKLDFSQYDSIFHVAGIAHADVGKVSDEQKALYYNVNTKLAVEVAFKAKESGVKQFILMSSMIIYGDSAGIGEEKIITKETVPNPDNFYGDSKWQADKGVRELQSEDFKIVVVRPPMIYGKGSKGNYPLLVKLVNKVPLFPDIDNKRSMLYIDNLCEFIKLMIDNDESGIFFPQNSEYVKTKEMVKLIGKVLGKPVKLVKIFNPLIILLSKSNFKIGKLFNKALGNLAYEQEMSVYNKGEYRKIELEQSILLTEKK